MAGYGLHETLEMLELTTFKTTSLTKVKTMHGLISDERLKEIFQLDADTTTRQLEELGAILTKAREQEFCR